MGRHTQTRRHGRPATADRINAERKSRKLTPPQLQGRPSSKRARKQTRTPSQLTESAQNETPEHCLIQPPTEQQKHAHKQTQMRTRKHTTERHTESTTIMAVHASKWKHRTRQFQRRTDCHAHEAQAREHSKKPSPTTEPTRTTTRRCDDRHQSAQALTHPEARRSPKHGARAATIVAIAHLVLGAQPCELAHKLSELVHRLGALAFVILNTQRGRE